MQSMLPNQNKVYLAWGGDQDREIIRLLIALRDRQQM